MIKRTGSAAIVLIALGAMTFGCGTAPTNKPTVAIVSPVSNSQFRSGDQIAVQSVSNDPTGVARVQLAVDGDIVRADMTPTPQTRFTVTQMWAATPGVHLLTVQAFNVADVESEPAQVYVSVPAVTPTPLASPTANRACVSNAAFVGDVSIPDGTVVAPGQAFNKIWRVRNTGTCTWGAQDQLVFVSGEAMRATTPLAIPTTVPGAAVDLLVVLSSPETPGNHAGNWRMKNTNSGFFGPTLQVKIDTVPPTASCLFTPVIESFTAAPTTITLGQSATLSWGRVLGAERADINNDIGGVATPGSITVKPTTTTTYTLLAACGSKTKTAEVTITVSAPPTATRTVSPTPTATTVR